MISAIPDIRSRLASATRPERLAILVEVVRQTQTGSVLEGEVRSLIREWQMELKPMQRKELATEVVERRREIAGTMIQGAM